MNRPALARPVDCRSCGSSVYLALCRDGRWRTFERATVPAAPTGVWAWRRTWGMEEQELVPGHLLHYCAGYRALSGGLADVADSLGRALR